MTDPTTIDVYTREAEAYKKRFKNSADRNLKEFMDALPELARVLDLGCGPGSASVVLMEAGHEVVAIDASPGMVKTAQAAGVPARLGTFDDVPGLGPFDGVWANFSLLHAPRTDLPRHLGAIADELRPGGAFHIGLKTGTGTRRDTIGRLYTYVSEDELTGLLRGAGFGAFSITRGRSAGLDGTESDWIIILARAHA